MFQELFYLKWNPYFLLTASMDSFVMLSNPDSQLYGIVYTDRFELLFH